MSVGKVPYLILVLPWFEALIILSARCCGSVASSPKVGYFETGSRFLSDDGAPSEINVGAEVNSDSSVCLSARETRQNWIEASSSSCSICRS